VDYIVDLIRQRYGDSSVWKLHVQFDAQTPLTLDLPAYRLKARGQAQLGLHCVARCRFHGPDQEAYITLLIGNQALDRL
jgi:hypothetical protein